MGDDYSSDDERSDQEKFVDNFRVFFFTMKCLFDESCDNEAKWRKQDGTRLHTHCSDHKENDMVAGRLCIETKCKKEGTFIIPSTSKEEGTYCKEHGIIKNATQPMKGSFCITCKNLRPPQWVQATKAASGETKPQFCSKHAKEMGIEIINVRASRCTECKKTLNPTFGFKEDGKKTHCTHCKKEGMVDLHTKRCRCGQTVKPSFGFVADGKMVCCKECKDDGMENIRKKSQILCKCVNEKHIACFGFAGDLKPSCCKKCKEVDMIDIKNKKCGCAKNVLASFGYEDGKGPTHCCDCKMPGMKYKGIQNQCKSNCGTVVNLQHNKYGEYCLRCFIFKFPEQAVSRNFKTKELLLRKYIENMVELEHYKKIFDKRTGGCSQRRPDILIECIHFNIIVEVSG